MESHACAAIAGVATHIVYFNRADCHLHGSKYLMLFIIALLSNTVLIAHTKDESFRRAAAVVSPFYATWLAGVYASLLIYRAFLNPRNKFPGPFSTRISLTSLSLRLKRRDLYRQLDHLHKRYGQFVRIEPTGISVSNPKAVLALHGPGTKCTKGPRYEQTDPFTSLQSTRDKTEHDHQRRLWSAAFGDKALRGYEQRIRVHRQNLMAQLTKQAGRPINITKWIRWYSFDVMGDLAFGHNFGMVESGVNHWTIKLLFDSLSYFAYLPSVWLMKLLMDVPGLARDYWRFIEYCELRLRERMKRDVKVPDIFTPLLAPFKHREPTRAELNMLIGDMHLIIIAGSDTTAAALASIIYLLCRHPNHIEHLRNELAPFMASASGGEVLNEKIASLDHLNGVINETLRLFPPTPTEFQRYTPPEGITIDGTFIPGNTYLQCPMYVLGRSEDIYDQAKEFIPERWYKYPDMIKEKTAFIPFGLGRYGCIGKPVAMMNLRTTLARLLHDFDFGFAPGEDGTDFTEKAIEHVTFSMGPLNVVFTPRC
ncbi:cytochrome P450 [Aspergillus californicus]